MYREQVTCKGCGTEFEAHLRSRDYCSNICKLLRRAAAGTLGTCYVCHSVYWNEPYAAGQSRADFEKEHEVCRRTVLDREGRDDACRCGECKKRKGITEVLSVPPSVRKRGVSRHSKHRRFVLDRDGYVCQICGLPTDPEARPSDDRYPTLDHIASIALCGRDDEPDNLRTAHRWCNIVLSDGSYLNEDLVRTSALIKFT
jgi:5-methylcytosine-specific restriction endonuclease McrA